MKKDTQKRSRLQRYGHLNTSHFLLLGAGGGGLFVVLYGICDRFCEKGPNACFFRISIFILFSRSLKCHIYFVSYALRIDVFVMKL